MKKYSLGIFVVMFSVVLTACGVQPGEVLPPSSSAASSEVIISHPPVQNPPVEDGTSFHGSAATAENVLIISKDGRYRVDWSITAANGGRVELINKDQKANVMFRHVILSNLVQPSEGNMDVALIAGEYTLQVDVDGEWAYKFSLVQKMDF